MRYSRKISTESQLQISIVEWFGYAYPTFRKSLVKISNEGKRSWARGRQMKDEGLQPGFPDLFLFVPRSGFHGLAMELKAPKKKPTKLQLDYLSYLSSLRYLSLWFDDFELATTLLTKYMEGQTP